ncbi:MAG: ParB/RepB/Spo0J family partition protein [Phycisphaerae bacterium]|nr:ParB/RepB/Spo0J family partition protein [Phycisphaerae bacterium]
MKAKIVDVKEIPLTSLVIGKGQVRVRDVGKEIDELAASIAQLGQLEPIVVCPSKEKGKFEILTGQRRYLAHKQIRKDKIMACILDREVDETEAKVISVTENLVRRDLNRKDLIDACTALYRKYGSIKDVADETGLPYPKVALYVKYDRLEPELKQLVDANEVDLKVALRAQDAASVSGKYNSKEAVVLAKELAQMSGAQQDRVVRKREDDPTADVSDVIEAAKTGEKITQIVVTIGTGLHQSLKQYAKDEDTSLDDAACSLIEEALSGKGYATGE